jgi:hypothetical protein
MLENFAAIFAENNMAGLRSDYYVPNTDIHEEILNDFKDAKTENKVVRILGVKKNHNCVSEYK